MEFKKSGRLQVVEWGGHEAKRELFAGKLARELCFFAKNLEEAFSFNGSDGDGSFRAVKAKARSLAAC